MEVTKVNVYRSKGEWCYSAWVGSEFDSSDTLGVANDASEDDAKQEAAEQFPAASIGRVADL